MGVKTYPLVMSEEKLEEIRKKATDQGKSIKQFIFDAIEKELREVK